MKTLREILKEKGINQSVVSEALGIQQSNLRRYDDLHKRRLDEVLSISEATGIGISELIGMDFPQIQNSVQGHSVKGNHNSVTGNVELGECRSELEKANCRIVYLEKQLEKKEEYIDRLLRIIENFNY